MQMMTCFCYVEYNVNIGGQVVGCVRTVCIRDSNIAFCADCEDAWSQAISKSAGEYIWDQSFRNWIYQLYLLCCFQVWCQHTYTVPFGFVQPDADHPVIVFSLCSQKDLGQDVCEYQHQPKYIVTKASETCYQSLSKENQQIDISENLQYEVSHLQYEVQFILGNLLLHLA